MSPHPSGLLPRPALLPLFRLTDSPRAPQLTNKKALESSRYYRSQVLGKGARVVTDATVNRVDGMGTLPTPYPLFKWKKETRMQSESRSACVKRASGGLGEVVQIPARRLATIQPTTPRLVAAADAA